jgi:small subunit ribosomal protein S5
MAEFIEDREQQLESTTIGIYRTAATVKGGRRFTFGALVVVGDRHGKVGLGYGKAPGVPAAIEKAQKNARKQLKRITLQSGTLPHTVLGRFGASSVKLVPASPGTGVIAGATVRAVLEMAGVRDCLSKSYGSNNQKNLSKAAMEGLLRMRTKQQVAELRGVDVGKTAVDERIEAGSRFVTTTAAGEDAPRARGPVNIKDQEARDSKGGRGRGRGGRGGGGGGRGRGGRGGGGGGGGGDQQQSAGASQPSGSAPQVGGDGGAAPAPPAEGTKPAEGASE